MKKMGAEYYVISGLDDIAWLLKIRGRDVKCNPLTISYVLISEHRYYLFIDERKVDSEVKDALKRANVEIMPYDSIGEFLREIKTGTILLEPSKNALGYIDA